MEEECASTARYVLGIKSKLILMDSYVCMCVAENRIESEAIFHTVRLYIIQVFCRGLDIAYFSLKLVQLAV